MMIFFFIFAYFFFLETKGYTMEEVGRVFDGKDYVEEVQVHAYDRDGGVGTEPEMGKEGVVHNEVEAERK